MKILTESEYYDTAAAERETVLDVNKKPCYIVWIPTQRTNRLRKLTRRRTTCSQTKTPSPFAPFVALRRGILHEA